MTAPIAPLVSVIIPTYNRLPYLRQAIQSVLEQSYRRWELIVVDDGSTDGTADYVTEIPDAPVRLLAHGHCGNPARLRNIGIEQATGHYVAFLDSDDLWDTQKLIAQVEPLQRDDGYRWGYTGFTMMNAAGDAIALASGSPWRPHSGWVLRALVTTEAAVAISTVVAERDLVREVRAFDEDPAIAYREDYDLVLRMAARAQVIAVPRALSKIRDHPSRSTALRDDLYERTVYVYQKFLKTVDSAGLRRLCHRQCARHLVAAANRDLAAGSPFSASRILLHAFWRSPWYGRWWRTLLKLLVAPLVHRTDKR